MFLLSKNDSPADKTATWRLFSQMVSLAQQICISGPPLGQEVQAESENFITSLSSVSKNLGWVWGILGMN